MCLGAGSLKRAFRLKCFRKSVGKVVSGKRRGQDCSRKRNTDDVGYAKDVGGWTGDVAGRRRDSGGGTEPDAGAAERSGRAAATDAAKVEFDYTGSAGIADHAVAGRGKHVDDGGSTHDHRGA